MESSAGKQEEPTTILSHSFVINGPRTSNKLVMEKLAKVQEFHFQFRNDW